MNPLQNQKNKKSPYDYLYKFIIIGDSGVGKSCLVKNYCEGHFSRSHNPTIGLEFASKILDIQNLTIKLHLWDTAGQEVYKSLLRQYYRQAIGAILVYDVSDKLSFQRVVRWMKDAKENSSEFIKFYLVGNKTDLEQKRQVSYQEGQQLAWEYNINFTETSNLNNQNVNIPFESLAEQITDDLIALKIPAQEEFGIKKWNTQQSFQIVHPKKGQDMNLYTNLKSKCSQC